MVGGCGGSGSSGPPAPSGLSYTSPNLYPVGIAIAPLQPAVSGTVTQYSVAPALPAGLMINSTNGVVSGTPTAPTPATNYTVTAQNSGGSTSFGLSIAVITVTPSPAAISRTVVGGSKVTVALSVTAVDFAFSGNLTATASDANGAFETTVTTVAASNSAYLLSLGTSTTVAAGHYTGTVTVNLCSGTPCATPQPIPSVKIPYDLYVLTSASAWPGNNLTTLVPWAGTPDWTTFQGNAAHTGYVPVQLDPNSFSTRWQIPAVDIPVSLGANLDTLTTSNGQLYIGGGTILYARKEFDGSSVWQYDFSGLTNPSVNPPAVANGVVYVAAGQSSSTYMFAFNAADGGQVFQSPMTSQFEHYLAPTIGPDGAYTNAGYGGGLYGFDSTGQQLFFANTLPQTSEWTPAVDASAVYAYTGDALRVLDPKTGAVQTTIVDPTFQNYVYAIDGSAVLGAPGSVFAANYNNALLNGGAIGNTLIDFDLQNNSIAWQVAGAYPNTPAYNAGVVYATNNKPLQLEARSEKDGTLLWSWVPPQAADFAFVSETLLTKNLIFVSTDLATYAIDLSTHATVWSYPLVGKLALSQNGVLYIEAPPSQSSPPAPGNLTAINVK